MVRKEIVFGLLFGCPLLLIIASLFVGRFAVPADMVLKVLAGKMLAGWTAMPEKYQAVIWDIRLPRAILGALVGGALATCGAAFQSLFRNPLISSGNLGVSSGAGFGAALAILLFDNTAARYIFAFGFGGLAVIMSCLIGSIYRTTPTIMLVLGGVIVSSVFTALISFAKFAADPYNQLPAIVFWLMGSLASAGYRDLLIAGGPVFFGVGGLMALRWRLNVLAMGEREARALGVNTGLCRSVIIACATLATAGVVCVSGVIGWVGLIIPHIGRMLVGNDNCLLLPVSFSLGACFLIIVDNLARLVSGSEVPLGVLTALVGAPFFVYLLKKTKGKGW